MRLCFLLRGKLAAHVDRELGPWWAARVEAHLTGCDQCHAEVEALRRLDQALVVEDSELGGDLDGRRLLASLHAALDRPATMRSLAPIEAARPRSWAVPALASGLAMGACLMIVLNVGLDRGKDSANRVVHERVAVAPAAPSPGEREAAFAGADAKEAEALAKSDRATRAKAAAEVASAGAPLPLDALTAEMDHLMMRVEKTGSEVTTTVARARQVALERGREVAALPAEEDPWTSY